MRDVELCRIFRHCDITPASHCRILVGVIMANKHTGKKYQVCHKGKNLTCHNGKKTLKILAGLAAQPYPLMTGLASLSSSQNIYIYMLSLSNNFNSHKILFAYPHLYFPFLLIFNLLRYEGLGMEDSPLVYFFASTTGANISLPM